MISIGGINASTSKAVVGVVLNAPVMKRSALFCVRSRVLFRAGDLPFQKATLPYVMIGSIMPRYSCLRQS